MNDVFGRIGGGGYCNVVWRQMLACLLSFVLVLVIVLVLYPCGFDMTAGK